VVGLTRSRTVAVQWLVPPVGTETGSHSSVVVVGWIVAVRIAEPFEPACVESPPYVPVIVCAPTAAGVYVTEHFPVASSVQVVELKVPELLLVQVTVPLAVVCVPTPVSVTVAVHVDEPPAGTLDGEQLTPVEVVRLLTVTVSEPELVPCFASPP